MTTQPTPHPEIPLSVQRRIWLQTHPSLEGFEPGLVKEDSNKHTEIPEDVKKFCASAIRCHEIRQNDTTDIVDDIVRFMLSRQEKAVEEAKKECLHTVSVVKDDLEHYGEPPCLRPIQTPSKEMLQFAVGALTAVEEEIRSQIKRP